jgi:hypothetical protein
MVNAACVPTTTSVLLGRFAPALEYARDAPPTTNVHPMKFAEEQELVVLAPRTINV